MFTLKIKVLQQLFGKSSFLSSDSFLCPLPPLLAQFLVPPL